MRKQNAILLTKKIIENVYNVAYITIVGLGLGILLATIINYLENQ
jgi:hypothetical protein